MRPHGKHVRSAERAAFAAGARAVEWKNGGRHWRMEITLPNGRTITHLVARKLSLYEGHIAGWIEQRMRQEMRKERSPS